MKRVDKQTGFTIVELLIVVVVIAILAAITIVAYNGIQNRAKESALQTSASQNAKKILSYAPLNNGTFPTEANYVTELNLPANTNEATYDYYASNDGKSFCFSVTNTTLGSGTSIAFTQSGSNIKGRCVKNLVINPSFESGVTGWSGANSAAFSASTAAAMSGANGALVTTSSTSDSGIGRSYTFLPNTRYTLSCTIRSKATTTYNYMISAQATAITSGTVYRPLTTDQQDRISTTLSTGATTGSGMMYCLRAGGQSGSATYHVDAVMLTQTDRLYSYGDGYSDNWSWVDAANNSASFGPALPQ